MVHILYLAAESPERTRILKRLRAAHLDVYAVSSGREAVAYLRAHAPELAFVDISTLAVDPEKLLTRLRRSSPGTAFVIITEASSNVTVPPADGHLRKPFTTRTFKARMRAALARREEDIITQGPFRLDLRTRTLSTPRGAYRLTPLETALMREFMTHPGEVLDRSFLMHQVWNTDYMDDTRTLDVHIHWLRRKIEANARAPEYLKTVHRVGYRFDVGTPEEDDEE